MNRLRSHILVRLVALLASITTLTVTVAPSFSPGSSYTPYGAWVRTQLNVPIDEGVDRVLGELAGERFASIESFLLAFVDAYEKDNETAAADLFGIETPETTSVVAYLQGRYSSFAGEALPARYFKPYVPVFTGLGDRAVIFQTDAKDFLRTALTVAGALVQQVRPLGETSLLRSVIQPQGP